MHSSLRVNWTALTRSRATLMNVVQWEFIDRRRSEFPLHQPLSLSLSLPLFNGLYSLDALSFSTVCASSYRVSDCTTGGANASSSAAQATNATLLRGPNGQTDIDDQPMKADHFQTAFVGYRRWCSAPQAPLLLLLLMQQRIQRVQLPQLLIFRTPAAEASRSCRYCRQGGDKGARKRYYIVLTDVVWWRCNQWRFRFHDLTQFHHRHHIWIPHALFAVNVSLIFRHLIPLAILWSVLFISVGGNFYI